MPCSDTPAGSREVKDHHVHVPVTCVLSSSPSVPSVLWWGLRAINPLPVRQGVTGDIMLSALQAAKE